MKKTYVLNLMRSIGLNLFDDTFICSMTDPDKFSTLYLDLRDSFVKAGLFLGLEVKREDNFVKYYLHIIG